MAAPSPPIPESALDGWLWPLLTQHAPLRPTPLCPELRAFTADDELPLWQAVEAAAGHVVDAPFYAVAWPGAQALARAILDAVVPVADRRVLDLGCGSGVAAIAAASKGADVVAVDVDPFGLSACRALADTHGVRVRTVLGGLDVDQIDEIDEIDLGVASPLRFPAGEALNDVDVVLIGDLVYNQALGRALRRYLRWLMARHPGVDVVVADSGRPFFAEAVTELPLVEIARHDVAVPAGVEGQQVRTVCLSRLLPRP